MEENTIIIKASERGFVKLYKNSAVEEYKNIILNENLLNNSRSIELDITFCRLGYPSTPHFIDLFLEHLAKLEGKKSLVIEMGCISYSEWVCLNVIVLEGEFFGIMEKINSKEELDCVKKTIDEKLKDNEIIMTVVLDDKEKTTFCYGK